MKKIYIAEDEEKIKNELSVFLEKSGYESIKCKSFDNIVEEILTSNCSLVLLDINLPKFDGYYICKQLRKTSNVPIIVVTSKNTEIDELISLNLGADGFITKPYNLSILLAHIEAILKRLDNKTDIIIYNDFKLDILKSVLYYKEKSVELSKNEFKILNYLFKNVGKIVSREEIMSYLWDNSMYIDDNTLTVNINRVRKRLEEISNMNIIETKRGQGYIIV
ncbi:MAG: response regulator transcription factor [Clostridia bacterium]